MANYFFIVILFSFSFQMFSYTNTLGKIKRVFEGFDYSYAQQGVIGRISSEDQEYGAYFYPLGMNRVIKNYFANNFKNYPAKIAYSANGEFSEPYIVDGKESTYYTKVKVVFECTFNTFYHYEDSKSFVIKEKQ